jgi:hypothetical protein
MDGGCAEVESEGVDVEELRARTRAEAREAEERANDLVEVFLKKIATAPIVTSA